jgi:hypothetical protein
MSSLTATVVLGNRHFFDGDINPLDQIEIYEGSTVAFHVRSFSEGVPTRAWMNVNPLRARETLFALLTLLLPDFEGHPLAAAPTVDCEQLEESMLQDLASVSQSTWSFALDATLRDGCTLKTEDFALLEVASIIVFTPTFRRESLQVSDGGQ